ncbi:hypothetical protein JCM6882_002530 [Rhodosporidiobolus microsporus]
MAPSSSSASRRRKPKDDERVVTYNRVTHDHHHHHFHPHPDSDSSAFAGSNEDEPVNSDGDYSADNDDRFDPQRESQQVREQGPAPDRSAPEDSDDTGRMTDYSERSPASSRASSLPPVQRTPNFPAQPPPRAVGSPYPLQDPNVGIARPSTAPIVAYNGTPFSPSAPAGPPPSAPPGAFDAQPASSFPGNAGMPPPNYPQQVRAPSVPPPPPQPTAPMSTAQEMQKNLQWIRNNPAPPSGRYPTSPAPPPRQNLHRTPQYQQPFNGGPPASPSSPSYPAPPPQAYFPNSPPPASPLSAPAPYTSPPGFTPASGAVPYSAQPGPAFNPQGSSRAEAAEPLPPPRFSRPRSRTTGSYRDDEPRRGYPLRPGDDDEPGSSASSSGDERGREEAQFQPVGERASGRRSQAGWRDEAERGDEGRRLEQRRDLPGTFSNSPFPPPAAQPAPSPPPRSYQPNSGSSDSRPPPVEQYRSSRSSRSSPPQRRLPGGFEPPTASAAAPVFTPSSPHQQQQQRDGWAQEAVLPYQPEREPGTLPGRFRPVAASSAGLSPQPVDEALPPSPTPYDSAPPDDGPAPRQPTRPRPNRRDDPSEGFPSPYEGYSSQPPPDEAFHPRAESAQRDPPSPPPQQQQARAWYGQRPRDAAPPPQQPPYPVDDDQRSAYSDGPPASAARARPAQPVRRSSAAPSEYHTDSGDDGEEAPPAPPPPARLPPRAYDDDAPPAPPPPAAASFSRSARRPRPRYDAGAPVSPPYPNEQSRFSGQPDDRNDNWSEERSFAQPGDEPVEQYSAAPPPRPRARSKAASVASANLSDEDAGGGDATRNERESESFPQADEQREPEGGFNPSADDVDNQGPPLSSYGGAGGAGYGERDGVDGLGQEGSVTSGRGGGRRRRGPGPPRRRDEEEDAVYDAPAVPAVSRFPPSRGGDDYSSRAGTGDEGGFASDEATDEDQQQQQGMRGGFGDASYGDQNDPEQQEPASHRPLRHFARSPQYSTRPRSARFPPRRRPANTPPSSSDDKSGDDENGGPPYPGLGRVGRPPVDDATDDSDEGAEGYPDQAGNFAADPSTSRRRLQQPVRGFADQPQQQDGYGSDSDDDDLPPVRARRRRGQDRSVASYAEADPSYARNDEQDLQPPTSRGRPAPFAPQQGEAATDTDSEADFPQSAPVYPSSRDALPSRSSRRPRPGDENDYSIPAAAALTGGAAVGGVAAATAYGNRTPDTSDTESGQEQERRPIGDWGAAEGGGVGERGRNVAREEMPAREEENDYDDRHPGAGGFQQNEAATDSDEYASDGPQRLARGQERGFSQQEQPVAGNAGSFEQGGYHTDSGTDDDENRQGACFSLLADPRSRQYNQTSVPDDSRSEGGFSGSEEQDQPAAAADSLGPPSSRRRWGDEYNQDALNSQEEPATVGPFPPRERPEDAGVATASEDEADYPEQRGAERSGGGMGRDEDDPDAYTDPTRSSRRPQALAGEDDAYNNDAVQPLDGRQDSKNASYSDEEMDRDPSADVPKRGYDDEEEVDAQDERDKSNSGQAAAAAAVGGAAVGGGAAWDSSTVPYRQKDDEPMNLSDNELVDKNEKTMPQQDDAFEPVGESSVKDPPMDPEDSKFTPSGESKFGTGDQYNDANGNGDSFAAGGSEDFPATQDRSLEAPPQADPSFGTNNAQFNDSAPQSFSNDPPLPQSDYSQSSLDNSNYPDQSSYSGQDSAYPQDSGGGAFGGGFADGAPGGGAAYQDDSRYDTGLGGGGGGGGGWQDDSRYDTGQGIDGQYSDPQGGAFYEPTGSERFEEPPSRFPESDYPYQPSEERSDPRDQYENEYSPEGDDVYAAGLMHHGRPRREYEEEERRDFEEEGREPPVVAEARERYEHELSYLHRLHGRRPQPPRDQVMHAASEAVKLCTELRLLEHEYRLPITPLPTRANTTRSFVELKPITPKHSRRRAERETSNECEPSRRSTATCSTMRRGTWTSMSNFSPTRMLHSKSDIKPQQFDTPPPFTTSSLHKAISTGLSSTCMTYDADILRLLLKRLRRRDHKALPKLSQITKRRTKQLFAASAKPKKPLFAIPTPQPCRKSSQPLTRLCGKSMRSEIVTINTSPPRSLHGLSTTPNANKPNVISTSPPSTASTPLATRSKKPRIICNELDLGLGLQTRERSRRKKRFDGLMKVYSSPRGRNRTCEGTPIPNTDSAPPKPLEGMPNLSSSVAKLRSARSKSAPVQERRRKRNASPTYTEGFGTRKSAWLTQKGDINANEKLTTRPSISPRFLLFHHRPFLPPRMTSAIVDTKKQSFDATPLIPNCSEPRRLFGPIRPTIRLYTVCGQQGPNMRSIVGLTVTASLSSQKRRRLVILRKQNESTLESWLATNPPGLLDIRTLLPSKDSTTSGGGISSTGAGAWPDSKASCGGTPGMNRSLLARTRTWVAMLVCWRNTVSTAIQTILVIRTFTNLRTPIGHLKKSRPVTRASTSTVDKASPSLVGPPKMPKSEFTRPKSGHEPGRAALRKFPLQGGTIDELPVVKGIKKPSTRSRDIKRRINTVFKWLKSRQARQQNTSTVRRRTIGQRWPKKGGTQVESVALIIDSNWRNQLIDTLVAIKAISRRGKKSELLKPVSKTTSPDLRRTTKLSIGIIALSTPCTAHEPRSSNGIDETSIPPKKRSGRARRTTPSEANETPPAHACRSKSAKSRRSSKGCASMPAVPATSKRSDDTEQSGMTCNGKNSRTTRMAVTTRTFRQPSIVALTIAWPLPSLTLTIIVRTTQPQIWRLLGRTIAPTLETRTPKPPFWRQNGPTAELKMSIARRRTLDERHEMSRHSASSAGERVEELKLRVRQAEDDARQAPHDRQAKIRLRHARRTLTDAERSQGFALRRQRHLKNKADAHDRNALKTLKASHRRKLAFHQKSIDSAESRIRSAKERLATHPNDKRALRRLAGAEESLRQAQAGHSKQTEKLAAVREERRRTKAELETHRGLHGSIHAEIEGRKAEERERSRRVKEEKREKASARDRVQVARRPHSSFHKGHNPGEHRKRKRAFQEHQRLAAESDPNRRTSAERHAHHAAAVHLLSSHRRKLDSARAEHASALRHHQLHSASDPGSEERLRAATTRLRRREKKVGEMKGHVKRLSKWKKSTSDSKSEPESESKTEELDHPHRVALAKKSVEESKHHLEHLNKVHRPSRQGLEKYEKGEEEDDKAVHSHHRNLTRRHSHITAKLRSHNRALAAAEKRHGPSSSHPDVVELRRKRDRQRSKLAEVEREKASHEKKYKEDLDRRKERRAASRSRRKERRAQTSQMRARAERDRVHQRKAAESAARSKHEAEKRAAHEEKVRHHREQVEDARRRKDEKARLHHEAELKRHEEHLREHDLEVEREKKRREEVKTARAERKRARKSKRAESGSHKDRKAKRVAERAAKHPPEEASARKAARNARRTAERKRRRSEVEATRKREGDEAARRHRLQQQAEHRRKEEEGQALKEKKRRERKLAASKRREEKERRRSQRAHERELADRRKKAEKERKRRIKEAKKLAHRRREEEARAKKKAKGLTRSHSRRH